MLRPNLARWLTVDPKWPGQLPYEYSYLLPTIYVDASGMTPCLNEDPDCMAMGLNFAIWPSQSISSCNNFLKCQSNPSCRGKLNSCVVHSGCHKDIIDCMVNNCDGTYCIDIECCTDGNCGCAPGVCATTVQGTVFTNCTISLCPTGAKSCWAEITNVVLHEISHCCGSRDHRACDAYVIGDCFGWYLPLP